MLKLEVAPQDGTTAMHVAAFNDDEAIFRLLLQARADYDSLNNVRG